MSTNAEVLGEEKRVGTRRKNSCVRLTALLAFHSPRTQEFGECMVVRCNQQDRWHSVTATTIFQCPWPCRNLASKDCIRWLTTDTITSYRKHSHQLLALHLSEPSAPGIAVSEPSAPAFAAIWAISSCHCSYLSYQLLSLQLSDLNT